ncbi:MAG: PstA family ABC transporter permease [Cellulosilyticaceae bacterium]
MNPKHFVLRTWILLSGILTILITLGIFFYILIKGCPVITEEFIFGMPKGTPLGTEGGILPAIIGSLLLGLITGIIGGILGLCTAIYLVFYSRKNWQKILIIHGLQALSGIPSIVLGLFGYSVLIMRFHLPRSLISAALTLSVMIIPFVTIRIKKALEETSQEQFMTSLNLGVSKSYTITHCVLPSVLERICSALSLGIGYAMGATAPIMFTGAVIFSDVPKSLLDPFMALPYHLYILANEGISFNMAYGTAFVLVVILLVINLICQLIGHWKGKTL